MVRMNSQGAMMSKMGGKWLRRSDTPDWVLTQYGMYLAEAASRDWTKHDNVGAGFSERFEFYERIVHNMEGVEFWEAMGARRALFSEMLRASSDDPEVNHVELLLEMAWLSARGCSSLEKMVERDRRRIGNSLARKSAQLIEEIVSLRALVEPEYSAPLELSSALGLSTLSVLEGIKVAGEKWSSSVPVVKRPSVGGAEIRYFVRGVASYFSYFYDQSLYAATASLASCVYGAGVTEERVRDLLRP